MTTPDELQPRLAFLLATDTMLQKADVPPVARSGAWDELRESYRDLLSARRQAMRWLAAPVTTFSAADELRDHLEREAVEWVEARLRGAVERYFT